MKGCVALTVTLWIGIDMAFVPGQVVFVVVLEVKSPKIGIYTYHPSNEGLVSG